MARKQKELIKAATIATALDKVTGKILGWAVKSNSSDRYYHIQTMIIDGVRAFFCDCEAHLWGHDECCHVKALKEVLLAKADLEQANETQAAIAEAEKIVSQPTIAEQGEMPVLETKEPTPSIEFGQLVTSKRAPVFAAPTFVNSLANLPLNGNQGFSLLK